MYDVVSVDELETTGNLSDEYLTFFFCEVVSFAGGPNI